MFVNTENLMKRPVYCVPAGNRLAMNIHAVSYTHASQYILAHGTAKKTTEFAVHNKPNTNLNTSICFLLWTSHVQNQQLTSSCPITWTHRLSLLRAVFSDLTAESGSCWIEAATHCVLSVTEWSVFNVATRILIRTYNFRTANKTLLPLRIFVSPNLWHPFA